MFARLHDEYGEFVRFRLGPLDMYLVTDPDLVQEVFTTHAAHVRKGRILEGAKVLLGEGLLTSEGEHHRRQRRLIQPAFHHDRLGAYADTMTRWASRTATRWTDGATVDVFSEMTGLTMGVTAETLFGSDLAADRARVEEALIDVFRAFDLLVLPLAGLRMRIPTTTVRRFRAAKVELEALVNGVIARRRAEGVDRGDLLSMLLMAQDADGDGTGMTDDEVRHEVMTLFAAGLETTANALTFAWWLLAAHPDERDRLEAEADALGTDAPGLADVEKLPFAGMVFNEALRLYPPVWMLARRCVAPFALGAHRIPEGGLVMMPPWLLHRDPGRWDEPDAFRPMRWAGNAGAPHRYSYIPFGAGSRKCIGSTFAVVEGTLALATIARTHRLERAPGHALELQPQITLRPKGGLPMAVRARSA